MISFKISLAESWHNPLWRFDRLVSGVEKAIRQSDGSLLTPFQQAQRYSAVLPYSQRPRWIVTCNFEEFLVYDMEKPNGEPEQILLKDLEKEYYRLQLHRM